MFHVSIISLVASKLILLILGGQTFLSHGNSTQVAIILLCPKVEGGWLALHDACTILRVQSENEGHLFPLAVSALPCP